jgi:hypothetical protein
MYENRGYLSTKRENAPADQLRSPPERFATGTITPS